MPRFPQGVLVSCECLGRRLLLCQCPCSRRRPFRALASARTADTLTPLLTAPTRPPSCVLRMFSLGGSLIDDTLIANLSVHALQRIRQTVPSYTPDSQSVATTRTAGAFAQAVASSMAPQPSLLLCKPPRLQVSAARMLLQHEALIPSHCSLLHFCMPSHPQPLPRAHRTPHSPLRAARLRPMVARIQLQVLKLRLRIGAGQ